jgi:hypothetical protein
VKVAYSSGVLLDTRSWCTCAPARSMGAHGAWSTAPGRPPRPGETAERLAAVVAWRTRSSVSSWPGPCSLARRHTCPARELRITRYQFVRPPLLVRGCAGGTSLLRDRSWGVPIRLRPNLRLDLALCGIQPLSPSPWTACAPSQTVRCPGKRPVTGSSQNAGQLARARSATARRPRSCGGRWFLLSGRPSPGSRRAVSSLRRRLRHPRSPRFDRRRIGR